MFSGPQFGPILNETFFPIFKKNPNPQILFFFGKFGFSFIHHTHKQSTTIASYFSFNFLMAKVCAIANMFLLTKNDIIVHNNKFLNLRVYHTNFPNLKGPRAPS